MAWSFQQRRGARTSIPRGLTRYSQRKSTTLSEGAESSRPGSIAGEETGPHNRKSVRQPLPVADCQPGAAAPHSGLRAPIEVRTRTKEQTEDLEVLIRCGPTENSFARPLGTTTIFLTLIPARLYL